MCARECGWPGRKSVPPMEDEMEHEMEPKIQASLHFVFVFVRPLPRTLPCSGVPLFLLLLLLPFASFNPTWTGLRSWTPVATRKRSSHSMPLISRCMSVRRFDPEDPPSTHVQARRAWKRNAPFSSPGLSPGISPGYSRLRSWPSGPVTFPTSVLPGTKKAGGATGKGPSPSSSRVFRPAIYSNPSP